MKLRSIEISDPRFETGGLRQVTVKSLSLKQRMDITLYIPKESPRYKNFPVVILLHGVYGSHWAWALKGGAHHVTERLIGEEKIRPMILAMPSDGLWGDGSGYINHNNKDYEQWIVEEVPEVVRQIIQINLNSPIYLAGLSMGGYGALRLGAKYVDNFQGIYALSSITDFTDWQKFMEENISDLAIPKAEQSALTYILKNKDILPPLRFDCGTEDELISSNRRLHEALQAEYIVHTYEEFPGGHQWSYWEAGLERSLIFFETILKSTK